MITVAEWKAKYGIKEPFRKTHDFTELAGFATGLEHDSAGNMQFYSPAYPSYSFHAPCGSTVMVDVQGFGICNDIGLVTAYWPWRNDAERRHMLFNYGCFWAKLGR